MRNIGWLLLFAVSLGYAQTGYKDDPRLKAPVSLSRNIVATQDALADLSLQSKVQLLCAQNIADHKLTAFFKGRPTVEVMDRLADLTQGEWRTEGASYRLFVSNAVQTEEKQAVEAEQAKARESAETQARDWMKLAKFSLEELKDRLQIVSDDVKRLQGATDDAGKKKYNELAQEQNRLTTVIREPYKYYAGTLFNQFGPNDWTEFWNGRPLLGTTTGAKGFRAMPPDALDPDPFANDANLEHKAGYLFVTYNDQTGAINLVHSSFRVTKDQGRRNANLIGTTSGLIDPGSGFETTPLYKRLTLWQTGSDKLSGLAREVRAGGTAPVSPYYHNLFTTADHLEWLVQRCDVQVLADAFRVSYPAASFAKGATLGSWLAAMVREQHAFVKAEGDWVMVKPFRYWTFRTREIPERILRPIEQAATQRPLEVEDYATFVSQLNEGQMRLFGQPIQYAVRFFPTPLTEAGPAFRFWSVISPETRRALKSGATISVGDMPPPVRDAFWQSVRSLILQRGTNDERVIIAFGEGVSQEQAGMFAFSYEASGHRIQRIDETGQSSSDEGCAFSFKSNEGSIANYITSLPQTKWPPPP